MSPVCSDKLLDVSLMRLAKYVWGQAGDSQGRLAALPPSLVAHLAERSVAESNFLQCVHKKVSFTHHHNLDKDAFLWTDCV